MMRPLLVTLSLAALAGALVHLPAAAQDADYDRKITLNLQNVSLLDALEQVFEGTTVQYVVEPMVPNLPITLNIREVPLSAILRLMVRQASVAAPGLTLSRDGDITVVKMRSRFVPPATATLPPNVAQRKVTLALRDVPFRTGVDALFRGSGLQYRVEENVPNVKVSLFLREVSLAQAFRLFLRQAAAVAPGITSVRAGDIIVIRAEVPRQVEAAPVVLPELEMPPPAPEPVQPWEKIALRHTDVAVLTRAMGGTLLGEGATGPAAKAPKPDELVLDEGAIRVKPLPERGRATPAPRRAPAGEDIPPPIDPRLLQPGMGAASVLTLPEGIEQVVGLRAQNALLVRGSAEGVRALREVIRLIDLPPHQYRIRLSTGTVAGEGQVVNGSTLSVTDVRGAERLAASLTPRHSGEGLVEVQVEGTLRVGGTERPIQSRVRVKSGAATPFLTLGEGPRARRVWLRATELPTSSAR